ncbi:hypothetical protein PHLCEN_2v1654 [Hermanssonia centrifuga]|uniref:Uncharacterized protein n=1 Tax=Hermanssonia centrifuga TaxID=98765 RepID=A0A2R6RZE1_9APHY|nr:hypothetical protein PHLCEN_2v1654 [Hermanssonia centrifuga]
METRSRLQQCLLPYLYPSRDQSESPVKSESGPLFAKERLILCVPAGFVCHAEILAFSRVWHMPAEAIQYRVSSMAPLEDACCSAGLLQVIRFNCWCHGPSLLHEASDAHLVDFHA